jgi:hypothetical protein
MFASLRHLGVVLALAGLALIVRPGAAWAQTTLTHDQARELRLYGAALVLARPGAGPALRRAGGIKLANALPIWRLQSGPALRVLPRLMRNGLVQEVEPDQPVGLDHHLSAGDPLLGSEWWVSSVGLDRAEPPGPGKPVTVIDTGVDLTHPEFANRPNTRALNAQSTSGPSEEHGTAVTSVVGAPSNGIGLVGVYPQAALQVWDASPEGGGISVGDVVLGLDAAIKNGPGVVNLSLGSPVRNPLLDQMVAATVASGSLVVAAAGNGRTGGSPLEYPASLPHVLTVGAIDQTGQPAYFSSGSPFVDLVAPGVSIPVAVPNSGYDYVSGTSFASPMVAGAAAWVWTARPTLDATQLAGVMRASAQMISSRGFDPFSGFGRLDIPAALAVAAPPRDPQEPNDDVSYVKPNGFLHRMVSPLTAPGQPGGAIVGRLEFAKDPRDVYRLWIPGKRTAISAGSPSGPGRRGSCCG